ncbi:hypothetical protein ABH994_005514 [Bradyrhizobium yuanmingense]
MTRKICVPPSASSQKPTTFDPIAAGVKFKTVTEGLSLRVFDIRDCL